MIINLLIGVTSFAFGIVGGLIIALLINISVSKPIQNDDKTLEKDEIDTIKGQFKS